MSLKTISPDQVTYYALNNEINIPVNDQIPLNKDKEALQAFLTENVAPNTMQFDSLADRLKYLVDNHYYEADFLNKYQPAFWKNWINFFQRSIFSSNPSWPPTNTMHSMP